MKQILIKLIMLLAGFACGQGTFLPNNPDAPTRLGTPIGPLAGPGIWGQFVVGSSADSLTPVGIALQHGPSGHLSGDIVTVPGIDGGTLAYVQMWAWDGVRWGTSLADVPLDQFGKTDIVPITLSYSFQPAFPPFFTQGAVVPVPEPSTFALTAIGGCALGLATFGLKKRK